ncbi:hypothetical protein [Streptomyces sp. RKAG337]|nr:hypothetical protein [Streptomyces sp. RKAG337]
MNTTGPLTITVQQSTPGRIVLALTDLCQDNVEDPTAATAT